MSNTSALYPFENNSKAQLAAWLSAIVDGADSATIVIGGDWRVRFWSRRAERLLGWRAESVLDKGIGTVLGLNLEGSRSLRRAVEKSGPHLRERLSIRRAGGSQIDVTISCRALPDDAHGGEPGYLLSLHDDASSTVNQEFQKFFAAVDQSMVGAVIANPGGVIEYANPRAFEILGRSPLAVVGSAISARMGSLAESLDLLPDEIGDQTDWRGDTRFVRADGQVLSLYVSASPIRDLSGRLLNRVVLFEDLTERRILENAERDLRDRLAHSSRLAALGEMATTIAHEINQPLAAIANYSRGSMRRIENGQWQVEPLTAALREISNLVAHAGDVIQNVRRMARNQPTTMHAVDLAKLIGRLMPMMRLSAESLAVRIETRIEPASPVILGDETQLSQVLLNLAKNGIEAMAGQPDDRRQLTIAVHERPGPTADHATLLVEIVDQGCGIADESLAMVGTPFFTLKPNGLGLGISIARTALEAHGSSLEVRHNNGATGGMTFSFELPRLSPQESA